MAKDKKIEDDKNKSRAEKIGSVITGLKKRYKGVDVLANARDDKRLIVPRVSTGLYGLDVATNGGYPLGRVTLVYGDAKGGKTTGYLRGLAAVQRLCANCYTPGVMGPGVIELPDLQTGEISEVHTTVIKECHGCGNPRDMLCFWLDAEGVWLTEWAEKMGVISEKVILMRPTHGEQGYDVLTAFAAARSLDLMVVDSLAQMTPVVEYEAGMEEQQRGQAARMNNKFIRKIVSLMNSGFQNDSQFTLWLINQYREKIGIVFGSNKTLPGGRGQLFANSIEIEFSPGKISIDDDTGEPILGEFKWHVKKNKLGPSGGRGGYKQWMSDTDLFKVGDIMEHEEVIKKAVSMDFIVKPNQTMYTYVNPEDGKELSFRGESAIVRYFAENPRVYTALKESMLRRRLNLEED